MSLRHFPPALSQTFHQDLKKTCELDVKRGSEAAFMFVSSHLLCSLSRWEGEEERTPENSNPEEGKKTINCSKRCQIYINFTQKTMWSLWFLLFHLESTDLWFLNILNWISKSSQSWLSKHLFTNFLKKNAHDFVV